MISKYTSANEAKEDAISLLACIDSFTISFTVSDQLIDLDS